MDLNPDILPNIPLFYKPVEHIPSSTFVKFIVLKSKKLIKHVPYMIR